MVKQLQLLALKKMDYRKEGFQNWELDQLHFLRSSGNGELSFWRSNSVRSEIQIDHVAPSEMYLIY
jgi:hypothetical protein